MRLRKLPQFAQSDSEAFASWSQKYPLTSRRLGLPRFAQSTSELG
jgi:hypothetical protein